YSRADIDNAMRWGFGWEIGPFETAAALGTAAVNSQAPTPNSQSTPNSQLPTANLRAANARVVRKNSGASLVDLGDGVLCVEFTSKMNAIGGDTMQMLQAGVKEASQNFAALVVGNDASNFSVGANVMLLLLEAQEGNWDEVDLMVRTFQGATMGLRYADVPVVVAPAGAGFGGGGEGGRDGGRGPRPARGG